MVIPKPFTLRSDAYLAFIRTHRCLTCSKSETVVAHHESLHQSGIGMKASDSQAVPLCVYCHHMRHAKGISSFWGNADVKDHIIRLLTEYLQLKEGQSNLIKNE